MVALDHSRIEKYRDVRLKELLKGYLERGGMRPNVFTRLVQCDEQIWGEKGYGIAYDFANLHHKERMGILHIAVMYRLAESHVRWVFKAAKIPSLPKGEITFRRHSYNLGVQSSGVEDGNKPPRSNGLDIKHGKVHVDSCPKCRGDLYGGNDIYGNYTSCNNCGLTS